MVTDTRIQAVAAIALAFLSGLAAQPAGAQQAKENLVSTAVAFVHTLAKGDFKAAEVDFNGEMKQAAPPEKLREIWQKVLDQIGPFQDTGETHTVVQGGYTTVIVRSDFKSEALGIEVSFDSAGRIAGMHFVPPP